jgi:hypothetical protein
MRHSRVGIYRYSVYITQRNLTKFEECSIPPQNLMEYHGKDCRGERNGRGATQLPVESLLNSEFICFRNCLSSCDIPGLSSSLVLSYVKGLHLLVSKCLVFS